MWWRRRGRVRCWTASGRAGQLEVRPIPGEGVALVDGDGTLVAAFDPMAVGSLRGQLRAAVFAAFDESPAAVPGQPREGRDDIVVVPRT